MDNRKLLASAGNYVSEWFGFRTFPSVSQTDLSLRHQLAQSCPFLSRALASERECVKPLTSKGVCTISSVSNGPRQDWLACPYRALDENLLKDVAGRLFGIPSREQAFIVPAPNLSLEVIRKKFESNLRAKRRCFVYLQNKLGGEISLSATDRSPELAFDITLVEILFQGGPKVGKFGIFETQTMDFHGTYRNVVKNLQDALRLHKNDFAAMVRRNPTWLSDHIEGPNIANVFKRTFYQMMLKFQIGMNEASAGCAIAIPTSVWDSWQRHLAKPKLVPQDDGTFKMMPPKKKDQSFAGPISWIYVFDLESESHASPNPIKIDKIISTNAKTMSYYALEEAPAAILAGHQGATRIIETIQRRIAQWWPEISR